MVKKGKGSGGRKIDGPLPSVAALEPDTLGYFSGQYVQYLRERNYSARTAHDRATHLRRFVVWCETRGVLYPHEVTRPMLEGYQRSLFYHRRPDGTPLTFRSQAQRLVCVRNLFKWLVRRGVLVANPASELELPRLPKVIPHVVLTRHEVEAILRLPDVNDPVGLRDRAMLEVLYATAIRRAELVALKVYDVDVQRGTLLVREGKGKKDRMVPLGERAGLWVEKYVHEGRPELLHGHDEGVLFLSNHGESISLMRASQIVRDWVRAAELGKTGACHLFRHTAATLMLENGADIRFIQALLGHAKLETTSVYTQVSIHKLKELHARTHPGAQLAPVRSDVVREDAASNEVDTRVELISLLAAESEDERGELGEGAD